MAYYQHLKVLKNDHVSEKMGPEFLNTESTKAVRHLHCSATAYRETPLVSLEVLAKKLGVKGIFVKDESYRFGLNAFKGLGGIYALACVICEKLGLDIHTTKFSDLQQPLVRESVSHMIFVTATDGNHGKGVAWAAGQLGCKAYVYMPKGSSPYRAQAIQNAGKAEVTVTDMGYDDTVRYARHMSEEHGWTLIQDTSWNGYETIPKRIIQGYTTMAYEAVHQLGEYGVKAPTHIFLQAGVGAMAGGITGFMVNYYEKQRPVIVIAEPEDAACIFESARKEDGGPHEAAGSGETIMAGLNCGEPCTITWPILRDYANFYAACPDYVAARGMRQLAAPWGNDKKVISGESGAVTMGLLTMLMESWELEEEKVMMGLNEESVILLFNTEGDTDPASYHRIVYDGAYATP